MQKIFFIIFSLTFMGAISCKDQRDQAVQNVYAKANWYPPILLGWSLAKVDKLKKSEAEKAIGICNDYEQKRKINTAFDTNHTLLVSMAYWACLTTVPALCAVGLGWLCGAKPSDVPPLTNGLIALGSFPLMVGAYGKSVMTHNKLLRQNCNKKVALINKKINYNEQD
jgi:hypothetical protein